MPGRALEPDQTPPPAAVSMVAPPPPSASAAVPSRRGRLAPAPLVVGAAPPGLDRQRWRDLRRGRLRPERSLDLHGSRAEAAHRAVHSFLEAAVADGLRCVAIITGKGSSAEGGVLRRELPHWLNAPELRPLLLGLAHPHGANAGAVHLLLRRRRP
jgi:DNA-nicking Smr family endonuclease